MVVCNDLEKAKEKYGFEVKEGVLVKEIVVNFWCTINKDNSLSFEAWDCWDEELNLDFLFEMFQEGILEKVEE